MIGELGGAREGEEIDSKMDIPNDIGICVKTKTTRTSREVWMTKFWFEVEYGKEAISSAEEETRYLNLAQQLRQILEQGKGQGDRP